MKYSSFELQQILHKMSKLQPPVALNEEIKITVAKLIDYIRCEVSISGEPTPDCSESFSKGGHLLIVTLESDLYIIDGVKRYVWVLNQ